MLLLISMIDLIFFPKVRPPKRTSLATWPSQVLQMSCMIYLYLIKLDFNMYLKQVQLKQKFLLTQQSPIWQLPARQGPHQVFSVLTSARHTIVLEPILLHVYYIYDPHHKVLWVMNRCE